MACECTEKRRLESLEHVVYGNGRNALRADIDMNMKRIGDVEANIKERRMQSWALILLILAQITSIAIAVLK